MATRCPALLCLAAGALACSGENLVLPADATPSELAVVRGDNQTGTVGRALTDSLVIGLTDAHGRPIMGQKIAFAPGDNGDGSRLFPDTTQTDSAGRAGTTWVLGSSPGTQHVVASVAGDSGGGAASVQAIFSATAIGNAGRLALVSQPGGGAVSGSPLPRQPRVQVQDLNGHPLAQGGVQVVAAVMSGGGNVSGEVAHTTNGQGIAEFSKLTVTGPAGRHRLIFAAEDLSSVVSDEFDVAGSGTSGGGTTGGGGTGSGTPPVSAPAPKADNYTILEDRPLRVGAPGLLANDGAGPLTAALAAGPSHGTAQVNADGSFQYQPQADYNGTDQFTYRASNAAGAGTATVTISITRVNDAPVFTKGPDQSVSQGAGLQTVPHWATGIMIGANNPYHDQVLNFIVTTDDPELFARAPAVSPDGTLTYQPAAGASGTARVTVVLHDDGGTANGGSDTSPPQTFRITVTP